MSDWQFEGWEIQPHKLQAQNIIDPVEDAIDGRSGAPLGLQST